MKSGVRRSGYGAELLKNGYCPSFVKRCIKMSSLRVTIRGARCGIGLFEVRVLRGVYGSIWCAPFPWYLMVSLMSGFQHSLISLVEECRMQPLCVSLV